MEEKGEAHMEKKIIPIGYEEFRLKYILKNEAPVRGSDEMLSLNSYLNRFVWGLSVIMALFPYSMYSNHFSTFVFVYTIIITLAAIFRPVGYLTYRISFHRYYRCYGD